jgi:hypothetical protein
VKPRVRKVGGFWWVERKTDRGARAMGPYVNWHQAMFIATHPKLWF